MSKQIKHPNLNVIKTVDDKNLKSWTAQGWEVVDQKATAKPAKEKN